MRIATTLALLLVAAAPARAGLLPRSPLTLVESQPVETGLDRPEIPDAKDLWPETIDRATRALDLAQFYVSNEPGGALDPTLEAIRRAAARGVRVRFLADKGFYRTYPEILDDLARSDGIEVRLIDYRALTGGVMHAKYFLVDGAIACLGSQNFDWRALEQIHEIGARVENADYTAALGAVFTMDWARGEPLGDAGDATVAPSALYPTPPAGAFPLRWLDAPGDTARLWPALSPEGQLPDSSLWDLPRIVDLMRSAADTLRTTCLTYNPASRDGGYWATLDVELRAAAARGVAVQLMVADWSKRKPAVDHLKSLAALPGIEVRFVTYPLAARGFIPFARVTHAKYLTVDGGRAWLGTSNWEKSYFFTTRNVGFTTTSRTFTALLDGDFRRLWDSPYATVVDPCAEYTVPRIGE